MTLKIQQDKEINFFIRKIIKYYDIIEREIRHFFTLSWNLEKFTPGKNPEKFSEKKKPSRYKK